MAVTPTEVRELPPGDKKFIDRLEERIDEQLRVVSPTKNGDGRREYALDFGNLKMSDGYHELTNRRLEELQRRYSAWDIKIRFNPEALVFIAREEAGPKT